MSRYDKQYYQKHKKQYNQSRKKYRNNNLKRIPLDVSIEWYDHLQEFCKLHNVKINTFIKQACELIAILNGYYDFLDNETQEIIRKLDIADANKTVQMQKETLDELTKVINRKAPNKPNELTDEELKKTIRNVGLQFTEEERERMLVAIYGEEELQRRRQEKASLERKE